MALKLKSVIISVLLGCVLGQHYEDKRCRCVCPSPAAVLNSSLSTDRKLFIANVPPSKCNCDGVILPRVGDEVRGREQEFCPRCECKYESRNTTVIMVVVVMVVWVITLLFAYMGFLICLDPLINKKKIKFYREHGSEEVNMNMDKIEATFKQFSNENDLGENENTSGLQGNGKSVLKELKTIHITPNTTNGTAPETKQTSRSSIDQLEFDQLVRGGLTGS